MMSPVPGRFVEQYTNHVGNVFYRFEAPDGRFADIRVRNGFDGAMRLTRSEAKALAMRRLGVTVPCPLGCGAEVVPGVYIDDCSFK